MKYFIVVNPISGPGRGKTLGAILRETLRRKNHRVDLQCTQKEGDAEAFGRRVPDYDRVIVVGGDGTVHRVVNGMPLSDPRPVLICPAGTGNVFGGEIRIPYSLQKLVTLALSDRIRWIDVGLLNGKRFLLMADAGFTGRIVKRFEQKRTGPTHMGAYVSCGVHTLLARPGPTFGIRVDGKLQTRNASFLQVANSRNYGGPFLYAPDASHTDGHLDVTWFTGQGRLATFRLVATAFFRNPQLNSDLTRVRARKVEITGDEMPELQVDGEYLSEPGRTFSIHPRAVPFLTPLADPPETSAIPRLSTELPYRDV